MPVKIIGNYVYNSELAGIGLQKGSVGIIEDNMVAESNLSGIAVKDSTAAKIQHYKK